MKLSKSLILAALVAGGLFTGNTVLQAQNATNTPPPAGAPPAAPRGMRGAANIDQMAATLKLDDATKAKFKTIMEDQQKKMQDMRADTSLSPQDRRTKVQTIREDTAKQMKAVLSAEQFDQWQKMNQPRMRRPATAPATPPQN